MTDSEPMLMTVERVAEVTDLSPKDVRRLMVTRTFESFKMGRRVVITVQSVRDWKAWRGDDPPAHFAATGYVYLLRFQDYYKIGLSSQPAARHLGISTLLPEPAELVHVIPTNNMVLLEKMLHARFQHVRSQGEWFRLSPDDVAMLCRCKAYPFPKFQTLATEARKPGRKLQRGV